jgi:hypothetical protein
MRIAPPAAPEEMPGPERGLSANGHRPRGDQPAKRQAFSPGVRCDLPVATTRIECDFRHGLIEPAIARGPGGRILTMIHGQERITIALSEHGLLALWAAVGAAVSGDSK